MLYQGLRKQKNVAFKGNRALLLYLTTGVTGVIGMNTNVAKMFHRDAEEWLEEARLAAEAIIEDRGQCTIEDVLNVKPLPNHLHRNTIGNVFKDHDRFRPIGYALAKKTSSHKRVIRIWTTTDPRKHIRHLDMIGAE